MTLSRLTRTGLFRRWSGIQETVGPETRLFRAVLDRALIDYFSHDKEIRQDVVKWLKKDNQDFIDVCEAASMNPDRVIYIFKIMRKVILQND